MDINIKYKKYFYEARRATSKVGKMVAVVDDELFPEFLEVLANDKEIPLKFRVCFGLMFSGGMRVSECLSVHRKDVTEEDGTYYLKINVLKKQKLKGKITRDAVVHPALTKPFAELIENLRPQEFIFRQRARKGHEAKDLTRHNSLYWIKKYIGESLDNHSLRHSNVSALLPHYSVAEISCIICISVQNVLNYANVNTKKKMKKFYARKNYANPS